MIPNAAIAETAATEKAMLVFLSFFFSTLSRDSKSVSLTVCLYDSAFGSL